jgi:hypothetical protein
MKAEKSPKLGRSKVSNKERTSKLGKIDISATKAVIPMIRNQMEEKASGTAESGENSHRVESQRSRCNL